MLATDAAAAIAVPPEYNRLALTWGALTWVAYWKSSAVGHQESLSSPRGMACAGSARGPGGAYDFSNARRNSSRGICACVRMVRSIGAFRVGWFGMVRGVRVSSGVLPNH